MKNLFILILFLMFIIMAVIRGFQENYLEACYCLLWAILVKSEIE